MAKETFMYREKKLLTKTNKNLYIVIVIHSWQKNYIKNQLFCVIWHLFSNLNVPFQSVKKHLQYMTKSAAL